ncbi:MAG: hypothetical protein ABFD07_16550 [Methanobacterium sp.]
MKLDDITGDNTYMPIVDGEEVLRVTVNQLDEFIFNVNFGAITYRSLQPTTTPLFSSQTVAVSSSVTNTTGVYTGNNAKMSVSFAQTGSSTDCTMILYGSDYENLSIPRIIATINLGAGQSDGQSIDPYSIPAYTFAELVNSDSAHAAIGTVEITTWQEPE